MSTKVANTVTDENVQDIIDTASYGGITYWWLPGVFLEPVTSWCLGIYPA